MQKLFSFLVVALAIFILLPGHAYSRGGGGRGDQDAPQDTPRPTPSPTPASVPVKGVITVVTPFAVSINNGPQTVTVTFKVSRDTTITLDGRTVTVADLKPGMPATIKPATDKVYADSVVASTPLAATPTPAPATSSEPPPTPYVPPAAQEPSGSTPSPFGQRFAP